MKANSRARVTERRENALAQRQRELAAWQNPTSDLRVNQAEIDPEGKTLPGKVATCEQDIANLTRKLGRAS